MENWALSSGAERFVDIEEVRGAKPLVPTGEAGIKGGHGLDTQMKIG